MLSHFKLKFMLTSVQQDTISDFCNVQCHFLISLGFGLLLAVDHDLCEKLYKSLTQQRFGVAAEGIMARFLNISFQGVS